MKLMKTMIFSMIAMFVANTATLAADDADTFISIKQAGDKKALIRVAKLADAGVAVLKIKNSEGYTLHREVITDRAYMKRYNFSSLPTGTYEVEVKTSNGVSKEVFQVSEGQEKAVYFKPAIQVESEMVKVAFMNKVDEFVSLKLYAENGDTLYQQTVAPQQVFSKGLDLSQLGPGKYAVSLMGDSYVYSRSIEIK